MLTALSIVVATLAAAPTHPAPRLAAEAEAEVPVAFDCASVPAALGAAGGGAVGCLAGTTGGFALLLLGTAAGGSVDTPALLTFVGAGGAVCGLLGAGAGGLIGALFAPSPGRLDDEKVQVSARELEPAMAF